MAIHYLVAYRFSVCFLYPWVYLPSFVSLHRGDLLGSTVHAFSCSFTDGGLGTLQAICFCCV
jgi:hypothetical protein